MSVLLLVFIVGISGWIVDSAWCLSFNWGALEVRDGEKISLEEADRLEKQLEKNKRSKTSHLQDPGYALLGYYFHHKDDGKNEHLKWLNHVRWFVETYPNNGSFLEKYLRIDAKEDKETYQEVKKLWLKLVDEQLPSKRHYLLLNAASFMLNDDSEEAERLFKLGRENAPNDSLWTNRLAILYERRTETHPMGSKNRKAAAQFWVEALRESKRINPPHDSRWHMEYWRLEDFGNANFDSGDLAKAKRYNKKLYALMRHLHTAIARDKGAYSLMTGSTTKIFKKDTYKWSKNRASHRYFLLQGRLALAKEDLKAAKKNLRTASKYPISVGEYVSPNWSLIFELYDRGERDAVIQYLDRCNKRSDKSSPLLTKAILAVRTGQRPVLRDY